MKKRKVAAMFCSAVLACSLISGCSGLGSDEPVSKTETKGREDGGDVGSGGGRPCGGSDRYNLCSGENR